jgi:hypothetical protein
MVRSVEPYRGPQLPERFLRWVETLRQRIGTIPSFTYLDGSPEGVVVGQQGDLAFDRVGLQYYQKTVDGGDTGWVALATGGGAAETLQQTYSASVPALILVNAVSGTFEIRDSVAPQTPPFVLFQVSDSGGTSIFDVTTSSGIVNAGPQAGTGQVNLFHDAGIVASTNALGWDVFGQLIDLDNSAAATAVTMIARNSAGGVTLNVNATTGNAQIGQTSGAGAAEAVWIHLTRAGQVELRHNDTAMARTATAGNGGFEINNTVTGAGFERALTVSDLAGAGGYLSVTATARVQGSDNADVNIADNVVIIGTDAFENAADADLAGSVVIGTRAMQNATLSQADGSSVVIGLEAFQDNVNSFSGSNVIIGTRAHKHSQVRSTNVSRSTVCIGFEAGERMGDNTNANNVLIGHRAGRCSTANNFVNNNSNVYIGALVGQGQNSGQANTAVGSQAMSDAANISGNFNVCIGQAAGKNLSTANSNVLIGSNAGLTVTTLGQNIIIGEDCAVNLNGANNVILSPDGFVPTQGDNNIVIGYRAGPTGGGVFFPTVDDNFIMESVGSGGINRISFLFGNLRTGRLVLGFGTGAGGTAGIGDRSDFGTGDPINIFKLLDGTAPTSVAANGVTMYSVAGRLEVRAGINLLDNDTLAMGTGADALLSFGGTTALLDLQIAAQDFKLNVPGTDTRFYLQHAGTDVGYFGATATEVEMRSLIHGAPVQLVGEDAGGTPRVMISADPDGAVSVRFAANIVFQTTVDGAEVSPDAGSSFEPVQPVVNATTVELDDITDPINTANRKVIGFMCFDTTLFTPVWASGSADGDTWRDSAGVVVNTPA